MGEFDRLRREAVPVRVAIVNDYEVIVKGLCTMLSEFPSEIRVVEVNWDDTPDTPVDIALFDTFASPLSSLDRVEELAQRDEIGRVVLYAWELNKDFTAAALKRPIHSTISKAETGRALVDKLVRISQGERVAFEASDGGERLTDLTEREREVLALIATGETNRAIADELFVSVDTVKTHVRTMYRKLGVTNRTQAAVIARDLGLIRLARSHR